MDLRIATTIEEYLRIIREIKSSQVNTWFRGQSNAEYSLQPSLFREYKLLGVNRNTTISFHKKSDAIMKSDLKALESFKCYYDKIADTKDFTLIDYLYTMQHYDIPTRLLDFTTDELIALYFSVSKSTKSIKSTELEIQDWKENKSYSTCGSAVFCIDPIWTNNQAYEQDSIINISSITAPALNQHDLPLCISTTKRNKRIEVQKGVFVLFGNFYNHYEYYDLFNNKTVKIFIPNSCRHQMLLDLKSKYKISHFSIFPDIKGVSLEIIDEINAQYQIDCDKYFSKAGREL